MDRLKKIQEYLAQENYRTKLYEPSEGRPFSVLVVNLGKDRELRDRILTIKCLEQIMGEALVPSKDVSADTILHTDFKIEYPFTFTPETTKELASLLHFINHESEVTGFCMDEVELKIYYRYHMFALEAGLNRKALISIVGMIMLFYDLYLTPIEQVAKGTLTFNELIAQVLIMAKESGKLKQNF